MLKQMSIKSLTIIALSASLCACGGGGNSSGNAAPTIDQSAAINSALTNIAQTLPEAHKPFTGAFAAVNGISVGWIDGTSADDVANGIALAIAQNQAKFPNEYKAMLSDAGLAITVFGDITGTTKFGTVQSMPDTHYVARMGKGNVIEVVRVQ
jgi:tetrahydromethanopterin S-methyltransferase subunit E